MILSTCKKRFENETEISPYIYEINKNFSEFDKRKELPNPKRKNFADDFKRFAKEIDHEQQKDSNLLKTISTSIADGNVYGNRWEFINTEDGFLLAAGYTVKKGGPNGKERQAILSDVFHGKIPMPETIRKSVAEKWGYRNSPERLQKIRNNIKVSLGSQKGRAIPSLQAIKKWEEDLYFIDQELKVELE